MTITNEERIKNGAMEITWLGHACYKITTKEYSLVIDPYEDHYVPGLGIMRETANQVLISHGHRDHSCAEVVEITEKTPSPLTITSMEAFHDGENGALRGISLIHIIDNGSVRVAHLGDLGCPLTEEQKEALKGLDALMIPIGGYYTIDAQQALQIVEEIRPKVVIPMHYRSDSFGYDVLGTLDQFTDHCEIVVEYPGNTLELTEDTDAHTAVLCLE